MLNIKLRAWIINSSLVVLSILFSLFLIEFCLRLFKVSVSLTGLPGKSMILDKELGWRLAPNVEGEYTIADGKTFYFKYNSRGFFERELSQQKQKNAFRIITTGDSFTWGEGANFQESYPKQLEQILDEIIESLKIEVINFGTPKYYTKNQKILIEQKALEYSPDLIIASFMSNDIIDSIYGLDFYEYPTDCLYNNFLKFFLKRSILFRWVFIKINFLKDRLKNKFNWFDIWNVKIPSLFKNAWKDVFLDMKEIQVFCTKNNIRLVVVYFPQYGEWTQVPQYGYDRLLPNKIISSYCKKNNIFFINGLRILLEDMRNEEIDPRKLYWPKDGHFNTLGYKYISTKIANHLLGNKLIEIN